MKAYQKHLGRFAVLGAVCALTVAVAASGQEESVLVEKPVVHEAVDGPELTPPASAPTLPPPERFGRDESATPSTPPVVKRPFMRPAVPRSVEGTPADLTAETETIPAPESAADSPPVHPAPPIKYDTDSDARRMYRHAGSVDLIMVTQNPADGCYYEIPLCIPGCCVGEPTVSAGHGIFGRGVVEYCWPSCGFRAIVKFRYLLGDVRVDYEGD